MLYLAVLEREEDGQWSAHVPDLPGCASFGATRAEALANIREAAQLHVAALLGDGLPLPKARTVADDVVVEAA